MVFAKVEEKIHKLFNNFALKNFMGKFRETFLKDFLKFMKWKSFARIFIAHRLIDGSNKMNCNQYPRVHSYVHIFKYVNTTLLGFIAI